MVPQQAALCAVLESFSQTQSRLCEIFDYLTTQRKRGIVVLR